MFTPSVIFALTFLFSKDFVKFHVRLLEVSFLCDVLQSLKPQELPPSCEVTFTL